METKHTPTPYRISGMNMQGMYTNDGAITLMAGDEDDAIHVGTVSAQARVKRGEGYKVACPQRDSTAAFILRACNMHDELVTALGTAIVMLQTYIEKDLSEPNRRLKCSFNSVALESLRTTYAKARGGA